MLDGKLIIFGYCTCRLAIVTAGVICAILAIQSMTIMEFDMSSYGQITGDWEEKPLVEVKVQEVECAKGWENLWTYKWQGTRRGCLMQNFY